MVVSLHDIHLATSCSAPVEEIEQQAAPDTTTGTRTEGQGDQSMVELDEAMKEIQASIDEFIEQPAAEGSDDESESEDEEEGGRGLNSRVYIL